MNGKSFCDKYNKSGFLIWKRSKVDAKGRVVLPRTLRSKLCLNENSEILFIQVIKKDGKENEFILELGVKK